MPITSPVENVCTKTHPDCHSKEVKTMYAKFVQWTRVNSLRSPLERDLRGSWGCVILRKASKTGSRHTKGLHWGCEERVFDTSPVNGVQKDIKMRAETRDWIVLGDDGKSDKQPFANRARKDNGDWESTQNEIRQNGKWDWEWFFANMAISKRFGSACLPMSRGLAFLIPTGICWTVVMSPPFRGAETISSKRKWAVSCSCDNLGRDPRLRQRQFLLISPRQVAESFQMTHHMWCGRSAWNIHVTCLCNTLR
jgi:hypothetical protein